MSTQLIGDVGGGVADRIVTQSASYVLGECTKLAKTVLSFSLEVLSKVAEAADCDRSAVQRLTIMAQQANKVLSIELTPNGRPSRPATAAELGNRRTQPAKLHKKPVHSKTSRMSIPQRKAYSRYMEAKIKAMRANGVEIKEIANKLKVSRTRVTRALYGRSPEKTGDDKNHQTAVKDRRVATARRLHSQGLSGREISKKMGVSPSSVSTYLKGSTA